MPLKKRGDARDDINTGTAQYSSISTTRSLDFSAPLFVGPSDGRSAIRPLERPEAGEQVAVVREEPFEDIVERFVLPPSVFELVLYRGADLDLLVGGTHLALTFVSTCDGKVRTIILEKNS